MEIPIPRAQLGVVKRPMVIGGILAAAGMLVQARDRLPTDVIVYMGNANSPPASVEFAARATVTWMYARIGVRLAWRDGEAPGSDDCGSPATVQVAFGAGAPPDASADALAYAFPFGSGSGGITVLYTRIAAAGGSSSRAQAILAHVLAHEIGHILQRTNYHAHTGVMKAHWNGQDYDSMGRKPLEFTSLDADLIAQGLSCTGHQ